MPHREGDKVWSRELEDWLHWGLIFPNDVTRLRYYGSNEGIVAALRARIDGADHHQAADAIQEMHLRIIGMRIKRMRRMAVDGDASILDGEGPQDGAFAAYLLIGGERLLLKIAQNQGREANKSDCDDPGGELFDCSSSPELVLYRREEGLELEQFLKQLPTHLSDLARIRARTSMNGKALATYIGVSESTITRRGEALRRAWKDECAVRNAHPATE